jgi:hypothetical protein
MRKYFSLLILFCLIISTHANGQDTLSQKDEFKPSGKISGYFFGDYAYKLSADELQRGNLQYSGLPLDYNSFNIRRIYLGYYYQFSPKISSQLTLAHESGFEANASNTDALTDNNRAVYIKYANVRVGGVIPRADIVFGQQATPTFGLLSDSYWGYRSIEKSLTDMRGISSSTDLGVGIFGKVGKSERVGYDLMVGNNNGAKLENNQFKKFYASLYGYLLDKRLVLQFNYEYNRTESLPGPRGRENLYKAFAGYKTDKATIGVEAFRQLQTNHTRYTPKLAPSDTLYGNAKRSGISIFYHRAIVTDKLDLFARVDFYDPDTKYTSANTYMKGYSANKEIFSTVGLDFTVFKGIHIMPNLWYDHYHSKLPAASGRMRNDADLVGRITVYCLFNQ